MNFMLSAEKEQFSKLNYSKKFYKGVLLIFPFWESKPPL